MKRCFTFLLLFPMAFAQFTYAAQDLAGETIQKQRAALAQAEKDHPGNTPEVLQALTALVRTGLIAQRDKGDLVALSRREEKLSREILGELDTLHFDAMRHLGEALLLADRAPEARILMERAIDLAQQVPNDHGAMVDASEGLAFACRALNDLKCQLKYAEQALASAREMQDPEKRRNWLVHLLQDTGYARYSLGDIKGAGEAMEESLLIAAELDGTDFETLSHLHNNAGSFYSRVGKFQNAKEHFDQAERLCRKTYGNDSPQLAFVLSNLGYVNSRLGKYSEAWKLFAESQQLRERWQGPEHSDTIANEVSWATSLAAGGDSRAAFEKSLHAARLGRTHFVLSARVLPERQALASRDTLEHGINVAASVVLKHPELGFRDVHEEVLRSRALVADEMALRQQNLNRDSDPKITLLRKELEQARIEYLHRTTSPQTTPEDLPNAAQRLERAERAIAQLNATERSSQRMQVLKLADLRTAMPTRSVLVSYFVFARVPVDTLQTMTESPWHYGAFVYDPERDSSSIFDLGERKVIDELVLRARGSVLAEMNSGGVGSVRTEREYRAAALELRQRIWDPLKNSTASAAMVFIVPDRRLNLIPFAALPDADGYLVDRPQVLHVLSSERDLIPQERTDRRTGLMAIGSPSFGQANSTFLAKNISKGATRDAALSCEEFQKLEFRPLPFAEAELREVTNTWKQWNGSEPALNLTGASATRERFIQEASRSRVLHIATHAYLLPESCGGDNPLMRSGLVFSGTGGGRDSGLLTAEEIAGLDLSGVDWAVLSACNTGNGEISKGEGVLGLQRAFRVAGARTVIMTLWPVDDNASRRFMHELYNERLSNHASTAEAMWHATSKMLESQRTSHASTHPWYWAGFVASGGWE